MSNVAKLKKRAAEFEQKKQFDKALALYIQVLDESTAAGEEPEVSLFNRVGDLMLRQGNVGEAVSYYERAVDLYAEGGFFNNAIALCNKILRHSPGRTTVYYKLGKISAKKGFKSDAKQNFLEYADRVQKAGDLDEAFRALKEFADLVPDQDDVRLMLAEQLTRRDRKEEALAQLQTLYEKFEAQGREGEARATLDRMRAIDPAAEPTSAEPQRQEKSSDLVFLDVSWEDPRARESAPPEAARAAPPPGPSRGPRGTVVLSSPLVEVPPAPAMAASPEEIPLLDIAGGDLDAPAEPLPNGQGAAADPTPVLGFEMTNLGDDLPLALPDALPLSGGDFGTLDLAAQALDDAPEAPAQDLVLGALQDEAPAHLSAHAQLSGDLEPAPPSEGGDLEFLMPASDLPLLDIEAPSGEESRSAPDEFDAELPMLEVDQPGASAEDATAGLPLLDLDDQSFGESAPASALDKVPEAVAEAEHALALELPEDAALEPETLDLLTDPGGTPEDQAGSAGREPMLPSGETPLDDLSLSFVGNQEIAPRKPASASLRTAVEQEPQDWGLRRRLAESLFDEGERALALGELEAAMTGLERAGAYEDALDVASELTRVAPETIRYHQKRVEYAFRLQDKPRLCDAYLELAEALFRANQGEQASAVYKRVLELSPSDARARAALALVGSEPQPVPTDATAEHLEPQPATAEASETAALRGGDGDFVNLGEWLRDESEPRSTRMVVDVAEPRAESDFDLGDMLQKFKRGVAESVDEDDHESHYDLGVAYKEMGLVDEAIAEFQKALRGTARRVRAYEALGHCFLEKGQRQVAMTVLERALLEPGQDDQALVGVLYLLGYANEGMGRVREAIANYTRVFAVDIQFRDVAERLSALERSAQ